MKSKLTILDKSLIEEILTKVNDTMCYNGHAAELLGEEIYSNEGDFLICLGKDDYARLQEILEV